MYTVKWQNNSGDWFESNYQSRAFAEHIYQWKKEGGVAKMVEFWQDDVLISYWLGV